MKTSLLALTAIVTTLPGTAQAAAAADGTELTAPGPEGDLHGTFVAPADGKPVVLLIPGSGPTDRDGNSPLGVKAAAMKLIADGLAEDGVGSARIDKRGMFASAAAIADPNAVTIGDYATDVGSWVATLRAKTGRDCIWVAGHSEGGVVALAAAGKVEGICGLVLISTPGRPLGTLIREQLGGNPAAAPLLPDANAAIAKLENGERVDVSGYSPVLQNLFAPQIQGYLIDAFRTDPAKLAAATGLPMLIVQGGKDLQVNEADAEALHAAQPEAKLVVVPDANHVLKAVEGDSRGANMAVYATPDLPLAQGVVAAIADFILSHTEK